MKDVVHDDDHENDDGDAADVDPGDDVYDGYDANEVLLLLLFHPDDDDDSNVLAAWYEVGYPGKCHVQEPY